MDIPAGNMRILLERYYYELRMLEYDHYLLKQEGFYRINKVLLLFILSLYTPGQSIGIPLEKWHKLQNHLNMYNQNFLTTLNHYLIGIIIFQVMLQ